MCYVSPITCKVDAYPETSVQDLQMALLCCQHQGVATEGVLEGREGGREGRRGGRDGRGGGGERGYVLGRGGERDMYEGGGRGNMHEGEGGRGIYIRGGGTHLLFIY